MTWSGIARSPFSSARSAGGCAVGVIVDPCLRRAFRTRLWRGAARRSTPPRALAHLNTLAVRPIVRVTESNGI
jgi:hypothetical protein